MGHHNPSPTHKGIMTRNPTESQLAEAYRWAVREGRRVSPTAAHVLTVILTYADLVTGYAYPKRETIARDIYGSDAPTKAQLNQISSALSGLVRADLLTREQMTNRGNLTTNLYYLRIGEPAVNVPGNTGHARHAFTGHGTPDTAGHGEPRTTGHHKYPLNSPKKSPAEHAGEKRHLKAVTDG